MTAEMQLQEAREAVTAFNKLDKTFRDKLLVGIKCLVFLQGLAGHEAADKEPDSSAQPTETAAI